MDVDVCKCAVGCQKPPPPLVLKKPAKVTTQNSVPEQLSPVEEFPPPPPPIDFGSAPDIIIPPPSFDLGPPTQFSPPALSPPVMSPKSDQAIHVSVIFASFTSRLVAAVTSNNNFFTQDLDNHSVSSSAGSDTISSVSQDGNRFSVATSGYSSDPSRSAKHPLSSKSLRSCRLVSH